MRICISKSTLQSIDVFIERKKLWKPFKECSKFSLRSQSWSHSLITIICHLQTDKVFIKKDRVWDMVWDPAQLANCMACGSIDVAAPSVDRADGLSCSVGAGGGTQAA